MTDHLTHRQIERLLRTHDVGRIGGYVEGRVYIVPVHYVYHKGCLYALAREELQQQLLRPHTEVCFQLEQGKGRAGRRNIQLWGRVEALICPDPDSEAWVLLQERLQHLRAVKSVSAQTGEGLPELPPAADLENSTLVYCLHIREQSAEVESSH